MKPNIALVIGDPAGVGPELVVKLLADAGWRMGDDGWLVNAAGQRLEFEFLTYTRTFERVAAPYQRNLEKLGVKLNVRMVDPALFLAAG